MIVHDWGLLEYEKAHKRMKEVHSSALRDGQNHLILCQHPNIFTIGQDEKEHNFDVKSYKTDRGGSITCHSKGQNVYYFCFHSPFPARFYAAVISTFKKFFSVYLPEAVYDKTKPGFYIENAKILSLGFRYKEGVSLHGVALNVSVDLDFHNIVKPCSLEGIRSSSLQEQGVSLSCEEVNAKIINLIYEVFDESI